MTAYTDQHEVLTTLRGERAYQDAMSASPERPDMIERLPLPGVLCAIHVALNQAMSAWYTGAEPHSDAMHFVRKIGGLSVQAGENFGMPPRAKFDFAQVEREMGK